MLFLPVPSSNLRRRYDSLGDVPPLAVKQAMRPLAPSGLGLRPKPPPSRREVFTGLSAKCPSATVPSFRLLLPAAFFQNDCQKNACQHDENSHHQNDITHQGHGTVGREPLHHISGGASHVRNGLKHTPGHRAGQVAHQRHGTAAKSQVHAGQPTIAPEELSDYSGKPVNSAGMFRSSVGGLGSGFRLGLRFRKEPVCGDPEGLCQQPQLPQLRLCLPRFP